MKRLSMIFLFFAFAMASSAATIYVDQSASGVGDGTSWQDAFIHIEDAIAASIIGDEIWVAAGNYSPQTTSEGGYYSLKNGVELYGGFAGTETTLDERDIQLNETILDGNINDPGLSSDNLIHVVKALNTTLSTRMDGFTIVNGRAEGVAFSSEMGGGFMNEDGSCTVANCTFLGNYSEYGGGAVAQYSNGILNMDNCTIQSNFSDQFGGGIIVRNGTLNLTNCDVSNNESDGSGGAIRVYEGIINIDRCTISGNISGNSATLHTGDEGAIHCTNTLIVGNVANSSSVVNVSLLSNNEPQSFISCTIAHNRNNDSGNVNNSRTMFLNDETDIRNCIIWDNNGVGTGEINSGGTTISHSIVSGGYTINGVQQPNIYQNDPEFINPGSTNLAPFNHESYDYRLPLLAFGMDAGMNSFSSDLDVDLDGNDRLNGENIDLGAYENPYCQINDLTILASDGLTACEGDEVSLSSSVMGTYIWSNNSSDSTVSVSSSGSYSLTVIDQESCLGMNEVDVTIFETEIEIEGETAFCEGEFTTLTATGDNVNYVWSDGQEGANAIFSEEGEYTVNAASQEGACPVQATVMVTEASTPDPAIFNIDNVLTTGFFDSYEWYLDGELIPGADSNEYEASENGDYYVIVTNAAGCGAQSPTETVDDIFDNVTELELNPNVFPRIMTNEVHIDFGAEIDMQITITDLNGRVVLNERMNASRTTLNVSDYPNGMYLLNLVHKSGKASFKLLKQ